MTPDELLLQAKTAFLPLSLSECAKSHKAVILDYEAYAQKAITTVSRLTEQYGPDGFSHRAGGKYVICASSKLTEERRRWTIAHELAHISLGHLDLHDGQQTSACLPREKEREADRFASAILAPQAVLLLCRPQNAAEVMKLTGISRQAAGIVFEELQKFSQRVQNPTDIQKRLIQKFLPFIFRHLSLSSV